MMFLRIDFLCFRLKALIHIYILNITLQLPAPEAELLTMNYMVSTQNSYYSLIGDGLSACNGGIGPAVSRG